MNSKIAIALIHNNDKERLSIIRPRLDELAVEFKKKMDVELYEICWQPEVKPISLRLEFLRELMYWKLNRDWTRYRKNSNRFFLIDFLSFIARNSYPVEKLRVGAIDMIVPDKHLRAFARALENKADYLVVFEDDAIFKSDSIAKLSSLIDELKKTEEIPAYIDLAGGCEFGDLKIDKLELKRDKEFRYYTKPVTNTVCCYLINRKQLELFEYYLTRMPAVRYFGMDWLLNKLFILQSKDGITSHCRHADPHFFDHGSVTGNFQTSIL